MINNATIIAKPAQK